jgi:ABC-type nickel/cobalt efflux system permease component RcnA
VAVVNSPTTITGTPAAIERVIESSPVIVGLLLVMGLVVWRTWRQERAEMMQELREERDARATAHKEMLAVADRSNAAVHAVREALTELRHAIKERA